MSDRAVSREEEAEGHTLKNDGPAAFATVASELIACSWTNLWGELSSWSKPLIISSR